MSLDTNQIVKIYQIPRFSVNNTVLPTVPKKWLIKVYNKSQLYIDWEQNAVLQAKYQALLVV